jgi:hypothetical protein
MPVKGPEEFVSSKVEARRAFLKNCAKYAVSMPPAISLLVSAQRAVGQEVNPNCSRLCAGNFPPTGEGCDCPEDELDGQSTTTDPSLFGSDIEENNPEANQ